jgi:hypothetical protein
MNVCAPEGQAVLVPYVSVKGIVDMSKSNVLDYFSSSSGKETSINLRIDSNKTLRDLLLLAEGRNDYTTPSH